VADRYDAVVVGAGPNGLAAALTLVSEGLSVCVIEAERVVGGGARSAELTLPGFVHDLCSAVHPLALGSPFFRKLSLSSDEVAWIHPPIPFAHPLDEGPAVRVERGAAATASALGRDGRAYRRLVMPFVGRWDELADDLLAPPGIPRRPQLFLPFALRALRSAASIAGRFETAAGRALIAGVAAHAGMPLDRAPTGGVALLLTLLAHEVGWPIPRGGSQRIADALTARLRSLGAQIVTGIRIASLNQLPASRAVLLDVTPRQLLAIAGDVLPKRYRRRLERFRYGPAVFKLDWALSEPIPWRDPVCPSAGTLHLGGTFAEIAAAERDVDRGRVPARPYVLLAQPSRFDRTRAPAGRHTAWGYCHLPHGADIDMTTAVEEQIERFAPGFRDVVLARSAMGPADLERADANHVGGSIDGGAHDLAQTLARPLPRLDPYATPVRGLYLCSSSTSPGSGVHGMCGFLAARSALCRSFGSK
jgi:phytoene dehydrogenase-like protein